MLNLSGANRLYSDIELLELAAKYILANGLDGEGFEHAISMVSRMVGYDPDFIRGFVGRAMQDLQKNKPA